MGAEAVITFGAHKGKKLGAVPDGYLQWMVDKLGQKEGWERWVSLAREQLAQRGITTKGSGEEEQQQDCKQQLHALASQLRDCRNLAEAKRLHSLVIQRKLEWSTFLTNTIIQMYGRCWSVEDARATLDSVKQPNMYMWNTMIAAYVQNNKRREAMQLFRGMCQQGLKFTDPATFVCVLGAASNVSEVEGVHARILAAGLEQVPVFAAALISAYARLGSLDRSRLVLEKLRQTQSPVQSPWNAMISTYLANSCPAKAWEVFELMEAADVEPDDITYISVVGICAADQDLSKGLEIHARITREGRQKNDVLATALLSMYGKCGSLEAARKIFDEMEPKGTVSWNAMLVAYTQNGGDAQAIELFSQMQQSGARPDFVTYSALLGACSRVSALGIGKQVHAKLVSSGNGDDRDPAVAASIVGLYGNCGEAEKACRAFWRGIDGNISDTGLWNAFISAMAQNGLHQQALQTFYRMNQEGAVANSITFATVLSACSHGKLLDEGTRHFSSVVAGDYLVTPSREHYAGMIDLLGRTGKVEQAMQIAKQVPACKCDSATWMSLLGACRIHSRVELAEYAAARIMELDPSSAAPYVLLLNIYTATGMKKQVKELKKKMQDAGVKRQPGICHIEVGQSVHRFTVGDKSNKQVCDELRRLGKEMKQRGYVPDTKAVIQDVEEDEKESLLCYHSEKLAIAYGLLNAPPEEPLMITKNLRVCPDCHSATKFISKIVGRKIRVRDANRLHNIENGVCSCDDYW